MDDVSPTVMSAMSFAQSLARAYVAGGGDPVDWVGAFVGLVAEQSPQVAVDTLKALDEALTRSPPPG